MSFFAFRFSLPLSAESHLRLAPALAAVLLFAAYPGAGRACSVCGCSLSSDWAAQGYSMMAGLHAGLREEYYDQSELRHGTRAIDRSALPLPNAQEIQIDTLNRNLWLDLDYVVTPDWAVTLQMPYYDRFHATIGPGATAISTSRASGLGDVRLVGRYQKFTLQHSYGLQFGLKLPTGRFDQNFASGPLTGEPLDRGLQLGSGTTDLLAGVSYFARPAALIGLFAQAMLDQPLASRDGFRPGATLAFNGGVRFLNASRVTPQMQLNFRLDGRENGVNADRPNSGDTMLYVSPGVTAELGSRSQGFAFVQVPLFQRVNGLQLEPRWLLSIGWRYDL